MPVQKISRATLEQRIEDRLRALHDARQSPNQPVNFLNPRGGQNQDDTRPNTMGTWRGSMSPFARTNIEDRMSEEQAKYIFQFFRGVWNEDRRYAERAAKNLRSLGGLSSRVQREVQAEMDDTLGGVLVPEEFVNEVIVELPRVTPFVDRNLIRIVPMRSLTKRMPKVKTKPAKPSIVHEEQAYSKSNAVFGFVRLVANKLGVIIPFTEDLLEDASVDMVQMLASLVAEQIGYKRNELITNGTGADEPEGVRTNENIVTATWDDTSDQTKADSLIEIFHTLPSQYRRDAIWMLHDSRIELIRKLKDAEGRYIWTDGFGAQPAMILGRPVFENPDIPTNLGAGMDESEILFGNFRRAYALGVRKGLEVERDSSGSDWEKDIVNFKFRERYDGRITDESGFVRGIGVR